MRVLNIADNPLPQEMLAAAAEGTHELLAFLRFIDQEGGRARRGETDIGGRGRGGQELVVGGPTRRAVGRASRPDSWVADQARRGGARRPGDHTERLGLRRPAGLPADPSAVFHRASGLPGGMETSGRARGRHDRAVVSDDPAPRRRRCPRSCRRHPWWPVSHRSTKSGYKSDLGRLSSASTQWTAKTQKPCASCGRRSPKPPPARRTVDGGTRTVGCEPARHWPKRVSSHSPTKTITG